MPELRVKEGLNLAYAEYGSRDAPALLLITGLGGLQEGWFRQIPYFQEHYRVVTFDNRGAGRSGTLDVTTTMRDFAEDAAFLLDHLDIGRSHVWGVSMGGKIAQELALARPERVARLVLENTSAGEAHRVEGPVQTRLSSSTGMDERAWLEDVVPALFGRDYREKNAASMKAFARSRVRHPQDPAGAARQREAYESFDSWERLPHLSHETLLLVGEEDALTDPRNAVKLASRIPHTATYVVLRAGHSLHIEAPDETNRVVDAFLRDGLAAVPKVEGDTLSSG